MLQSRNHDPAHGTDRNDLLERFHVDAQVVSRPPRSHELRDRHLLCQLGGDRPGEILVLEIDHCGFWILHTPTYGAAASLACRTEAVDRWHGQFAIYEAVENPGRKAIGGHHRRGYSPSAKDDWVTPKRIIDAFGPFDLDPACCEQMPWRTADEMWTSGGLDRHWGGMVWLNPPYSDVGAWMERLAQHGNGIALVFARVETAWWFEIVWAKASAIAFPRGRLTFHRPDGTKPGVNSGAPSTFVAFGEPAAERLRAGLDVLGGEAVLLTGWRDAAQDSASPARSDTQSSEPR